MTARTSDVDINAASVARRKQSPISFVEQVLHDPETGKPFVLLPAEREFMQHAFRLDANGRLLYPEQCFSAPKKSGKTTLSALCVLTMV
jgi:hypothetical protein